MTQSYLNRTKIGFVGAGNMTRSLIGGLSLNPNFKASNIFVCSRSSQKPIELSKAFGVNAMDHTEELIEECDWIILAMKPQDLPEFLNDHGKLITLDKSVLSLCAGLNVDLLKKEMPQVNRVARLMPSTTCEVGRGVLGVYSEDRNLSSEIEDLFRPVGYVAAVESEDDLDKVMITAASGVGFVLEIMQIWSEWLEENNFDSEDAARITEMSFAGVGELIRSTGKSFSKLQSEVTSRKGVTLAGLDAMRHAELDRVLRVGFGAALKRSDELSRLF